MPNTIQKGSEKCEHSFELMNVAGLPEEVIFICPKCGTPQEGKITIKKPMTQTNTTQNKEELEIPKFIKQLMPFWKKYKKDKDVLENPNPPMGVVISLEGFWLWLMKQK